MSDQRKSGIEWTDQTWNPIRGCSKVSQGCKHCYAETMAARFSKPGQPYEKVITNGRWNGDVVLVPEHLADPLRWQRPRRVFVNSMSDLFHESLAFEDIAAVFGVMAAAPRHTFQVLTKRPKRALEFFKWVTSVCWDIRPRSMGEWTVCHGEALLRDDEPGTIHRTSEEADGRPWPLPNVWLGVSIEDQATADERIPLLLQCPAAVRWVSAEPLLGPVNLRAYLPHASLGETMQRLANAVDRGDTSLQLLDWVVVGGESGPGARPMHPDWARSLLDQCVPEGTSFLFKQWGDWKSILDLDRDDPDWRSRKLQMMPRDDNHRWLNVAGGHGFHGDRVVMVRRVGKHAAGRELDGKVWDQYPKAVTP